MGRSRWHISMFTQLQRSSTSVRSLHEQFGFQAEENVGESLKDSELKIIGCIQKLFLQNK